jgi:hypothetical protein
MGWALGAEPAQVDWETKVVKHYYLPKRGDYHHLHLHLHLSQPFVRKDSE